MSAPVLKEIEPCIRDVESASLRHSKLVAMLANATKRGEIEAVVAAHQCHAKRIPPVTPAGAVSFFARLEARLLVNQAGGILENAGLCLHRHFNDPYLPGSAVKGIARHAAWCEWNDEQDAGKKNAVARDIAAVFGFPTADKKLDAFLKNLGFSQNASAGTVAFLPAIPHEKTALALDLTNSHHMKYYGSDEANAVALDNEEPNPQFFPAVEAGAVFRFTLVPLKPAADTAKAKKWLLDALQIHGAGAKTAAGYGWFSYDEANSQEISAREAAAAKRKQEDAAFATERAALPALDPLPPENLRPAIATVEAFLAKWNGRDGLQQIRDNLAQNRRRLPQQSPADQLRERWERDTPRSIINGTLARFRNLPDADKTAIVTLLREPDGIGPKIWAELKNTPRQQAAANEIRAYLETPSTRNRSWDRQQAAANEIRAYCKNTLKLGKMP
jgi:CRISPR type III-B/RAMP module RAMP protein Cmr6